MLQGLECRPATADGVGQGMPRHLQPCPHSQAASTLSFLGESLFCTTFFLLLSLVLSGDLWGWVRPGTGPLPRPAVSSRPAGDAKGLRLHGAISMLAFLCIFASLSLLLFLTFWLLGFF